MLLSRTRVVPPINELLGVLGEHVSTTLHMVLGSGNLYCHDSSIFHCRVTTNNLIPPIQTNVGLEKLDSLLITYLTKANNICRNETKRLDAMTYYPQKKTVATVVLLLLL